MSGWASIYNNTRAMLQFQGQAIARLQEQATTGSRLNRPSDAPADAFRLLQSRAGARSMETYARNLGTVRDTREIVGATLQGVSNALARARELMAQAASGTYQDNIRAPVAAEVDELLEQVLAAANRSYRNRYLFGGGRDAPFTATREGGRIVRVEYTGGTCDLSVPVCDGVDYAGVQVGSATFGMDDRQAPRFFGSTGAQPGAGTATVRGDAWLTLAHTATTYLGASGVAPGDSSPAGDTVLGTGHTLTIDQPAGTVHLDNGEAVSFTGAETDLRLSNGAGDVVYVNVTGLAAGFQGTVSLRADGTLSLDDGRTTVPLTFTAADAVADSRTGEILHVNTAGVARAGLEPVRVPGTYDVFEALIASRDAIFNARRLPEDQRKALLDEAMGALVDVTAHLSGVVTASGAQLQALERLKTNLETLQGLNEQQADALENADIVDVASDLARRQVLYEMALASAARLLSLSLVKYL